MKCGHCKADHASVREVHDCVLGRNIPVQARRFAIGDLVESTQEGYRYAPGSRGRVTFINPDGSGIRVDSVMEGRYLCRSVKWRLVDATAWTRDITPRLREAARPTLASQLRADERKRGERKSRAVARDEWPDLLATMRADNARARAGTRPLGQSIRMPQPAMPLAGVIACDACSDISTCHVHHVDQRVHCGRCAGTGAFITYVENGVPKGPGGPCFRCSGKGHHSAADRRRNDCYDRLAPIRY